MALRLGAEILDRPTFESILAQPRFKGQVAFYGFFYQGRRLIVNGSGSTTRKKVVIRKLDKELMKGYLDSEAYVTPLGVELLDLEGRRLKVPLDQIKGVYFVREF